MPDVLSLPSRSARTAPRWRATFASMLCAALLGACATPPGPADIADASPEWLEAQKTNIAARAQARWDALIAGDFTRAYAFQTPAYRSVFSAQQFAGNFGNAVAWRLARVKSVQYDPSNVARVVVEVEYEAPVGLRTARGVRQMSENWLYSDGSQWYISQ